MRVFLSWSGNVSREIAATLADWLPLLMFDLDPFISDEIDKDARWNDTIHQRLTESSYGIAIVTSANRSAPWLTYESGAIATSSRLSVLLVDTDPTELRTSPLGAFQATRIEKSDIWKLIRRLNSLRPTPAPEERLHALYEALWTEFDHRVRRALHPEMHSITRYPIGGSTPFKGELRDIPLKRLDEFYGNASARIDLLGHSFSGLLKAGGRNALLRALVNGATIRIVYLDPTRPYSDQIAQVGERIEKDLRDKIRVSLQEALTFKENLRTEIRRLQPGLLESDINDARSRLRLAATTLISYGHLQRVDNTLLVSQYSQSKDPGRVAPTNEIRSDDDPALFRFYCEEFDRIWEESSPIEEVLSPSGIQMDRARILRHLPSIQSIYHSVARQDQSQAPLPYPKMLVVLPNMSCSIACKNCFTWRSKTMDRRRMSIPLFRSLLRQAQEMGCECIELSGGGEPLEHPDARTLLEILGAVRTKDLRAGVLTNGLAIVSQPDLARAILGLDYVRVGFTEYLDNPKHSQELEMFHHALDILGRARVDSGSSARIGVKLLLTTDNAPYVGDRVRHLLELRVAGSAQYIVDHIKIKSIRADGPLEPSSALVRDVEHELATLKSRYGQRAEDLQIDIKSAEVPSAYRCWLSPIMTVVDASGDVYLCCNFYESGDDMRIGSLGQLGENTFEAFWGGDSHRLVMENVSPAKVCNSQLGCHCRVVHYQELAEPLVRYTSSGTRIAPTSIFEGHDQML